MTTFQPDVQRIVPSLAGKEIAFFSLASKPAVKPTRPASVQKVSVLCPQVAGKCRPLTPRVVLLHLHGRAGDDDKET